MARSRFHPECDDLSALVAEAMRGERQHTISGNQELGWWTGRLPDDTQLLAAPYGEEVYLIAFDAEGELREVVRHPYPTETRPKSDAHNPIVVDHLLGRILECHPGFVSGSIAVKPFWIEEISFELHPLPDWVRYRYDGGEPLEESCASAQKREELREWLLDECCQVDYHSEGCWYNGKSEGIG